METFSKGEVVIYCKRNSPFYGTELIILSGPENSYVDCQVTGKRLFGTVYLTSDPEERDPCHFALTEHLRKKKRPSETLDITETRQRPAPTWKQIKQDCERELKEVETV